MTSPTLLDRLPRATGLAVVCLLAVLATHGASAGPVGLAGPWTSPPGDFTHQPLGALRVALTATPGAGYTPLQVKFQANVTGAVAGVLTVRWSFGDGTNLTGALNISHRYASAGRFVATVSVTDLASDQGNASVAVYTVTAPTPSQGPDQTESLGLIAAGAGFGGLVSFALYRVLERRRPPPEELLTDETGSAGETPPDGAVYGGPGAEYAPSPSAAPPPSPFNGPEPHSSSTAEGSPLAARRKASEEILVHLGSLGRPSPDEVGDPARTQGGMSERLGMSQNVVSPILRRLVAARVVTFEVHHVRNARRRLKVYRLTDRGEAVVREMRSRR